MPASSSSNSSTPAASQAATVVGAAVGGVLGALVLGLVATLLFVLRRRHKRARQPHGAEEQHQIEQEPGPSGIIRELSTHMDVVTELHGDEKTHGPQLHAVRPGHGAVCELPGAWTMPLF